jgi:ATP-dependent Lon protease
MKDSRSLPLATQYLELPLLPLKDIVIFPHMIVPVFVNEDVCNLAVEAASLGERKIFVSAFQADGLSVPSATISLEAPFDVYDVGVICSVMRTRKLPDGRTKVLVQGLEKAQIKFLDSVDPYPKVRVESILEPVFASGTPEVEALVRVVRENLEKVVSLGKILSPDILMILEDVTDPARLADLVSANLGLKVSDAQAILVLHDPMERLRHVHQFLAREIEVYQMQVRIQSQAKEEISKMQREHYLREQIRALRSELGEHDPKDDVDELWKKIEALKLPKEVHDEVSRQAKRLERMHQDSSEANLIRNYIDTITALPWNTRSEESVDLHKVQRVLDEDHYGLKQIKDRIIEFLAVKKLNPKAKSPIICFVGPPGVGKTSLGRSIAKAVGREFSRISLGGVRDEADIRGHRKTYVGAFPGRVIQSIKTAGTSNPVIMLDEIDKLGSDSRGDPSAALLEVLDPEQNKHYVDHFLGVAFDLSDVMFIANANNLETIPAPLRDRLEVIEVSGYTDEEKVTIAFDYIIPNKLKDMGLEGAGITFSRASLEAIINNYTRESGLRGLEKQISSICRKIARQVAEDPDLSSKKKSIKLTPVLVERHLGAHRFTRDLLYREGAIGVALGLAYTSYGGEVLPIETNLVPTGKAGLVLTGQLGDVMKESAQAAYTFVRANAQRLGIKDDVIQKHELHVHMPAGAVPKDGPSAGIALATSLISALKGVMPKEYLAMTGEITLNGYVLPIGGLKEKMLAAARDGIQTVLIPERNRSNFNEIEFQGRKRPKVIFVKSYFDVFEQCFSPASPQVTNPPLGIVPAKAS